MFEDLSAAWQWWHAQEVLRIGLGPVLCFILSYTTSTLLLEWLSSRAFMRKYLISYKGAPERTVAKAATRVKIPVATQLKNVTNNLFGPLALVNGVVGYVCFRFALPTDKAVVPTLVTFVVEFVALQLLGDFFLYWGHRVQHENQYLWDNHHKLHHTLDTPTPLGTIYIDNLDATLQGGLPIIFAAAIVRGHVLTVYAYIAARIAENVLNHSGLDCWWLNIVTLKCLPGRASIAHHDSHHRFSFHGHAAKNYGENFVFWDWVFGTHSDRSQLIADGNAKAHE